MAYESRKSVISHEERGKSNNNIVRIPKFPDINPIDLETSNLGQWLTSKICQIFDTDEVFGI